MQALTLLSLSRTLLVALAAAGMIFPNAAMPCCGCCSAVVQLSETVPTCCGKEHSCCQVAARPISSSCCDGNSNCGDQACRCQILPAHAVPLEAPLSARAPTASELHGLATISENASGFVSLTERMPDDATAPHLGGASRLHAWLCVWLN